MKGKLSAEAIVERGLAIGDTEGLEAVTIRRLATELGVTPMALYWHFKNKDQLLVGMADHLVAGFAPEGEHDGDWLAGLRAVLVELLAALRRHPCARHLLEQVDHAAVPSFLRVWDHVLGLARAGGFTVEESCLISVYLLQTAIAFADVPAHRADRPEVAEQTRLKRLSLESLPPGRYPNLVAMAGPMAGQIAPDVYDDFGVELILGGIAALAGSRE
ncbi:TetR/AcrR family transcriptional regulator [Nonomuraea longicatena]|uniref:TetR/AcrR family transcriptional regulator C-terminal domain-containing protein n=1 Tax=Nonomuraea longicatena TaxID=83682 RepID=A0ABN1QP18_9ACTN